MQLWVGQNELIVGRMWVTCQVTSAGTGEDLRFSLEWSGKLDLGGLSVTLGKVRTSEHPHL